MSHLFNLGKRIRKLREQRGLTQAALADRMAISPSYLNQIENDARPLNRRVLGKLEQAMGIDFTDWTEDEDRRANQLCEALNDPLFRGTEIPLQELRDAVSCSPRTTERFLQLFRAHQRLQADYQALAESIAGEERIKALHGAQFPYEDVRDFFYRRNNHIESLDHAAERLFETQGFSILELQNDLARYLEREHGNPGETRRHRYRQRPAETLRRRGAHPLPRQTLVALAPRLSPGPPDRAAGLRRPDRS
ncbi:MAG: helix-turn-helix domain-containing protein [Candidatus Sedimenticola endophacoides]